MTFWRIAAWVLGVIALMFWAQVVIGLAAFAIPDRYQAPESLVLSGLVLVFGIAAPGLVLWALWMQGVIGVQHVAPREAALPGGAPAPEAPEGVEAPTRDDLGGAGGRAQAELLPIEPLTERETEILRQVAEGKSNKEIARDLVISTGTVKTHTNNLYRKLQARNRTDAVTIARRRGVL